MEQGNFQSADQFYSPSTKSTKRSKRIIFIVLIILILGALGFGGYQFISSNAIDKSEEKEDNLTPTVNFLPTDTPTPTIASASPTLKVSPTTKPSPTTTPKPTQNPLDKQSGLIRSNLSVEVLNGSGVVGAAKKAADILKELGYSVPSTGNADSYDYEKTVIEIKNSKSNYLDLLKKDLSGSYTIGSSSANLAASVSADARVIVGKQ